MNRTVSRESDVRRRLSLVAEPGDPRLRDLLQQHEPGAVLAAAGGRGVLDGRPLPAAWQERAAGVDDADGAALARARTCGLRWVVPGDDEWPDGVDDLDHVEPLGGTAGAPLGLWVRGAVRLDEVLGAAVAIVGARAATTYGLGLAGELGAGLGDAGATVVSGAAFGIDAAAHRGALAAGGATVAVLAGGADLPYPRAHASLLDLVAAGGAVVSEQPPGQVAIRARFLTRNRLIAALAGGTVVVEAAARSGSLNTLRWADRLGRTTMGTPGPVTSQMSEGVHLALRSGEAELVTRAEDVLESLGGIGAEPAPDVVRRTTAYDRLGPDAARTLDGLRWNESLTTEQVAGRVGLAAAQAQEHLTTLADAGYAERLGDGWTLVRRADLA
ncbi:DNA-processing protein DprA [Aeromicrobium massiliense]|uniref:DNA-processing protein DprA n=1 Tax=Aeromicrobium massiliense TaxID=1464554 RepID=UPI000675F8F8|nr:DNA-processing protein DprA [Aeromicrobium massiliense]